MEVLTIDDPGVGEDVGPCSSKPNLIDTKKKLVTKKEIRNTRQELTKIILGEEDGGDASKQIAQSEAPAQEKKKRRRKRYQGTQITICLTNCRYEVIRKVASAFGMKEVSEEEDWNLYWTDLSVSVERGKEMKRFQRINHFPGMLEICRKDLLARNLNRMQKIYPKEFNFFPKTWCFPADFGDALNYSKSRKNKTFIIKPECGSQGRGIFLTKSLKDMRPTDRLICQVYLSRPYLVDGYKFDIRVYTLVTSCDPLRVFVYNEGLVRFATSRYADPNVNNTTNVFMHLTNYAVNKHSRTYVNDAEAGSKRKISTLNKILASQGVDLTTLWIMIDEVIVKTVIAAWPVLKHSYHACFPTHDTMHACFELLGFDILLDHKLNPYILEVNHSPSFHTDTELDREVKESLLTDTMTMLNVWQCDKKQVLDEDRRRIQDRLQGAHRVESSPDEREPEKSPWLSQIQWEETHLGGFRRVYPLGEKYAPLFQQPSASIYTATASSRARGDCTKQQKDDFQLSKAKAEALILKPKQLKDQLMEVKKPEENAEPTKSKVKLSKIDKEVKEKKTKKAKENSEKCNKGSDDGRYEKKCGMLGSFEPEHIVKREEKERQNLMAQRDFLIRSYGLLEQIYIAMKRSGTLRPEDERKYGSYGQLAIINSKNHQSKRVSKSTKHCEKRKQSIDDTMTVLSIESCVAMIHKRPMT